jgi:hypothetical protein
VQEPENLQISGIIQEHAKEVPKKLGESKFRASNRRLQSLRKKHQIVINL